MAELISRNTPESADAEYRHYRLAGITVSTTSITFAIILLSWSISKFSPLSNSLLYFQTISLSITIILAFFTQFTHYVGYKHQARRNYHSEYTMESANEWFDRGDKALNWVCIFLLIGFLFSIALWANNI